MQILIDVCLPFFAVILTGWIVGRRRFIDAGGLAGLNRFTYWVALPPFLFVKVAEIPLDRLLDPKLIGAYYGAGLIVYAIAVVGGRRLFGGGPAISGIRGLGATFSNVGYMGLPLVIFAFGPEAAAPAMTIIVLDHVLMMGLTVLLIESERAAGGGLKRALIKIARGLAFNPLILTIGAGALYGVSGLPLPKPVAAYGNLVGLAAAPCALFALGANLAGCSLARGMIEVSGLALLKIVVHPLLVLGMATIVFALDPLLVRILVLEASLPIAVSVFVLADQYRMDTSRISAAILVSTLGSVATVSLALTLLGS
ncbi:AEC family transporter [Tistrella mobilis]|uniref:AEC family transporter n=1 Tax=Tistrella mobilis TaxID=171437 RepID=UPI003557E9F9